MLIFYDCLHDLHILAVLNNYYYIVDATRIRITPKWMLCNAFRDFVYASHNNELSMFHTYRMYPLLICNMELNMFGTEYDFVLAVKKGWTIKK